MTIKYKISKQESQDEMSLSVTIDAGGADYSSVIREIAESVASYIGERTRDGLDVNGKPFKKQYSEAYIESAPYEAFKDSNEVNLDLSGEMLNSLYVLDAAGNSFRIGWRDAVNTAKAFNHNTGDTLPKREFFGVKTRELDSILSEYDYIQDEFNSAKKRESEIAGAILNLFKGKKVDRFVKAIAESLDD